MHRPSTSVLGSLLRRHAHQAHRILKVGGQLWVTEMDFETPAFARLRANPLLFSLIRSTEPYLDVYADYQPQLAHDLARFGFGPVRLAAATGRHFALVAALLPALKRSRRAACLMRRLGCTAARNPRLLGGRPGPRPRSLIDEQLRLHRPQ